MDTLVRCVHYTYVSILLLCLPHGAMSSHLAQSDYMSTESSQQIPVELPVKKSMLQVVHKVVPRHHEESVCVNGYSFRSLTECQDVCKFPGSSNVVRRENYKIPVSYKLVTLMHDNYVVKDGKLKTTHLDIETSDFVIRNGTAFVCYHFKPNFVHCMHRCVEEDGLNLTDNGTGLYVADYRRWYPFGQFYLMNSSLCTGAAICISELTLIFQQLEDVHLILDSLSTACLWITLILCLALPEMQVKINKALLYHLAMLAIGYTIICWKSAAMMYLSDFLTDEWCISLSSVQQFALLSAFFWMNVQSYELYSSLRQPSWPDILSWLEKRRWVFHWLYGWMLPFVITILSLLAEVLFSMSDQLSPGFAEECWFNFKKKSTLYIWYYGWMAISLFINLLLFVFITKSLQKWSKDVEIVNNGSLVQTYVVLIKLMFIMGFCWFLNLLRWSLTTRGYIVYALDMVRALQGFYIFVAYVCRPRIWARVIKRCLGKSKTLPPEKVFQFQLKGM